MSVFENAFSGGVWASLVFLLVVGTFALSFVLRRENKLPHDASYAAKTHLHNIRNAGIEADQQQIIELQEQWDLSEILLVVVGAICQQGCARDPSTSASRILLLSLLLLATVVITAFSAVLVAGVSTQNPTCFLDDHSKNRPMVLAQTDTSADTRMSPFSRMQVQDVTEGAFPSYTSYKAKNLTSNTGLSNISDAASKKIYPVNAALPNKPKENLLFPHIRMHRVLSRTQLKELEAGLTKRHRMLQTESTWGRPSCQNSEGDSTSESLSISLSDVWPAIAEFIGGLAVALVLLIAEQISSRQVVLSNKIGVSRQTSTSMFVRGLN